MKRPNKKRLGEVLQERGKISSDDLKTVIAEQPAKAIYLGEILFERGLVAKPDIVMALEEVSQFQYVLGKAPKRRCKSCRQICARERPRRCRSCPR